MSAPRRAHAFAPAVLCGLALLVAQGQGYLQVLLPVLPLLLLVGSLLVGFYPGCDTLVRLAERHRPPRRRQRAGRRLPPLAAPTKAISGGLLIACHLARRPPPALAQAS